MRVCTHRGLYEASLIAPLVEQEVRIPCTVMGFSPFLHAGASPLSMHAWADGPFRGPKPINAAGYPQGGAALRASPLDPPLTSLREA